MRYEKVIAHDFGPFHDRDLTFGPGMNVVYGPNESGKSTWHAALFAGLCGLRRGPGRSAFNEAFSDRHRPWDNEQAWRVGSVIALEDGRRVELTHDLANRVDSSAKDADLAGRDYSDEILFEGAPDGSRWLGLNRNTFLSTACIRQTQLLGVLDEARSLQEDIQRAASTAGDATAKAALDLIEKFRAAAVGSDRAPTRPLRVTGEAVDRAIESLEEARRAHQDYLDRRGEIELLSDHLADLEAQEAALRALLIEERALSATSRAERISELAAGFEDGPPYRPADEEELSNQIATALQKWQGRPRVVPLAGASINELENQIEEIDQRIAAAADTPAKPGRRRPVALLASSIGSAVAGSVSLALIDPKVVGAGLLAASLGLLIGWILSGRPEPHLDSHAEVSRLEARRDHIEHLITDRQAAEISHQEAKDREAKAIDAVTQAATAIGLAESDPAELAEALFSWQKDRRRRLQNLADYQAAWDSYQNLLGGQTREEIEMGASQLQAEARAAVASCDPAIISSLRADGASEEDLRKVRDRAQQARDSIHTLNGELRQFMSGFRSVSEAEEVLDSARAEHARVRSLDATLALTVEFLRTAEEEVHRNLAPVLKETVEDWLGAVTGGRYTECKVDPETLRVEVRGPEISWRRAELLSHGTREQVYLLLRLALARHLTAPGEVCPLILDDVLASFDHERRDVVLETLHAISEEVQVILFTHDADVTGWARRRFEPSIDALIELQRV